MQPGHDLIELELQAQLAKSYSQERKEKLALEVISRLQQQQQLNGAQGNRISPPNDINSALFAVHDNPSAVINQPALNTAQRLRAALRMANNTADGRPLLSSEELPPADLLASGNLLIDRSQFAENQNIFIPNADYEPTHQIDHNESAVAGDKLEAATADIILSEYPMDCFPEHWYERFPCCLEDTVFWRRWKKLR